MNVLQGWGCMLMIVCLIALAISWCIDANYYHNLNREEERISSGRRAESPQTTDTSEAYASMNEPTPEGPAPLTAEERADAWVQGLLDKPTPRHITGPLNS